MATRQCLSAGQDDETIRGEALARSGDLIEAATSGMDADETIVAPARRAIDEVV